MVELIRSKIGFRLLITFSVVLALLMVSLIYIATQMVGEFGEFSASRNEANIRDNSNAFLARITHEQALRYDTTFKKFAASSALIAKQAAFFLENMTLYGKTPLNPNEKLDIYPHNGIFSNDRSERTMVLYWGSSTMSAGINEQINTLSYLDPLLETMKEGNPESVACYAVTKSGIARYYPNIHGVEELPSTTKFDIRNANWYVIAKPKNNLERKTVWSNIYLDSVGQGLLTTASTPIYSKSGQYLGAAGVDVTLDTIVNDILAPIPSCNRNKSISSFLVDNQGRFIAFPPEYLDMFQIKIDRDKLVDASAILKHSLLDSSNLEIRKIGENILEKNYQISGFILNEQPYIISSHFMPSTGWRLCTVVPESVILTSVQETRNALDSTVKSMATKFTLVTILFLIVSIIVIAILFIKDVIRPLAKLSKGALRVKEGELTTHVDIHTKDEMGLLAQLFNTMVDALREAKELEKEYTQTLAQKVKDRTREIMIKNKELEKTRERLELAMDAGEHGFWDWNLDTDDVYFSPRYCTMLGYEPDELPMKLKTWVNLMHPDDQKTIVPEVANYVKNARPYEVEFRLKTKAGDWKLISGRGKSYEKDVDGISHRAVGVHVDITERKKADVALRESERRLTQAVQGNSFPTFIIDNKHIITHWNNACESLTGFSAAEMVGTKKHWLAFYPTERPVLADLVVDGATEEEIGVYYEGEHHKSILIEGAYEGEYFFPSMGEKGKWLFFTAAPLRDHGGNIIGAIETFHDITNRMNTEEQLRQAQKMEAIGTLAGGVAHDFNNLLTTIIGNAQIALNDISKDDSLREQIEEIEKAGQRSASLTRQLLAFSRKQVIRPEVLNINAVINETEKMLKRMIGEDIEFQMILEPELWKVHMDSGQIEQIIINMAVNARDAMPQGGKLIVETVNVHIDENYLSEHGINETPGHYVMLALSDTGSGMDKETRKHIFEPFFTTKGIGKGTGLGLSTVYGIAKQNNGFIWVYSKSGQGTTFKIYLPKLKEGTEAEEKERTHVGGLNGSETVLIVEDDDRLRNLARKILERYGYSVMKAENGEDALKVSEEHDGSIDLLITDVVMPKMSGKETAEQLQPLYPQMKVIYMSGYTDDAIVHHGVLAPGLNFLEKPFTPEDLARKVREVLDIEN